MLCCQLENADPYAQQVGYQGDHPYVWTPEWVLGFNLDTGEWEMLHAWAQAGLMADKVTEPRPDLCLSDTAVWHTPHSDS